jgi:hypothetical protein
MCWISKCRRRVKERFGWRGRQWRCCQLFWCYQPPRLRSVVALVMRQEGPDDDFVSFRRVWQSGFREICLLRFCLDRDGGVDAYFDLLPHLNDAVWRWISVNRTFARNLPPLAWSGVCRVYFCLFYSIAAFVVFFGVGIASRRGAAGDFKTRCRVELRLDQ